MPTATNGERVDEVSAIRDPSEPESIESEDEETDTCFSEMHEYDPVYKELFETDPIEYKSIIDEARMMVRHAKEHSRNTDAETKDDHGVEGKFSVPTG